MNIISQYALRGCRAAYRRLFLPKGYWHRVSRNKAPKDFEGQAASDFIREKLMQPAPCMIGRFGSTELDAFTINKMMALPWKERYVKYITGENMFAFWEKRAVQSMYEVSGFFPCDTAHLTQFADLLQEDTKQMDILGSWRSGESLLKAELKNAKTVPIDDLEPYRHANPWSQALEGKKVLVIHPFVESIQEQYARRTLIFEDKRVLPAFELMTLKPVQSFAKNASKTGFETWFDALAYMKNQIDALDFDIAIIGCGAYGFSLAAHIKRSGKKAIHLGGATQLLFGIMGKRWEKVEIIQKLVNEYWVRPKASETPKNHNSVEDGCYW